MDNDPRICGIPVSVWDGISGIAATVGLIGGLVAAGYAFFEYSSRLEERRSERALELIDIWEERGASDAYRSLAQDVRAVADRARADLGGALAPGSPELRNVRRRVVDEVLSDAESAYHFDTVIHFFTRVAICVDANLCSEQYSQMFFGDTVTTFHTIFASEISDRRGVDRRFACEMSALAVRFTLPEDGVQAADWACPVPPRL